MRTPSERFVAAAAACEAFLLTMQLGDEDTLLAFRAAATRFADIRRAIAEKLNAAMRTKEERRRRSWSRDFLMRHPQHNLSVIGAALDFSFPASGLQGLMWGEGAVT